MEQPLGWRARLGIIYPASGLADMEYYQLCPPGVSVHVTRSSMPDEGAVTLEHMTAVAGGERFDQLAADLATVRPHCIAWMCTSGSFSRGPAWDAELRRLLSTHGRCPATTTSTSLVEGFRALGVKKVALGTPYEPRLNEKLVQYVQHFGFEVIIQRKRNSSGSPSARRTSVNSAVVDIEVAHPSGGVHLNFLPVTKLFGAKVGAVAQT